MLNQLGSISLLNEEVAASHISQLSQGIPQGITLPFPADYWAGGNRTLKGEVSTCTTGAKMAITEACQSSLQKDQTG